MLHWLRHMRPQGLPHLYFRLELFQIQRIPHYLWSYVIYCKKNFLQGDLPLMTGAVGRVVGKEGVLARNKRRNLVNKKTKQPKNEHHSTLQLKKNLLRYQTAQLSISWHGFWVFTWNTSLFPTLFYYPTSGFYKSWKYVLTPWKSLMFDQKLNGPIFLTQIVSVICIVNQRLRIEKVISILSIPIWKKQDWKKCLAYMLLSTYKAYSLDN